MINPGPQMLADALSPWPIHAGCAFMGYVKAQALRVL